MIKEKNRIKELEEEIAYLLKEKDELSSMVEESLEYIEDLEREKDFLVGGMDQFINFINYFKDNYGETADWPIHIDNSYYCDIIKDKLERISNYWSQWKE